MKLQVNSPGYVLTFAAVVSTVFTAAIMTLHAVSDRAAEASARLYEEKSLVSVFGLGQGRTLDDAEVRRLYRESIRPLDRPLSDPQTGIVFNKPTADGDGDADATGPRTFVAFAPGTDAHAGGGKVLGYALPIRGIGFWSRIDGYLAVTPDLDRIVGIVFIRHQETPGLGGRITEPRWRDQFRRLDIAPPAGGGAFVYVGGDKPDSPASPRYGRRVDAITGATGTSSAVERFVNRDIAAFRRAATRVGLIGTPASGGPRAGGGAGLGSLASGRQP